MPSDVLVVQMGSSLETPGATTAKPTQPYPFIAVPEKRYYYCARPGAKMDRPDGFSLHFPANIHESNSFHTINWLDNEIANGHPEVREATPDEIQEYLFRKDPKGYTRRQTIAEMETELSAKLAAAVSAKLQKLGVSELLSPEQILELMHDSAVNPEGEPIANAADADKLGGVDKNAELRAKFANIRSGNAVLSGATNTTNSAT